MLPFRKRPKAQSDIKGDGPQDELARACWEHLVAYFAMRDSRGRADPFDNLLLLIDHHESADRLETALKKFRERSREGRTT